jgi:hypothetical protein
MDLQGLPNRALRQDPFRFLLVLTAGRLAPHQALAVWDRARQPQRERYGITVDGGEAWAWLDDPEGPYAWPL